jgi:hypothetical protein
MTLFTIIYNQLVHTTADNNQICSFLIALILNLSENLLFEKYNSVNLAYFTKISLIHHSARVLEAHNTELILSRKTGFSTQK